MAYEQILVEQRGDVALITLNRPERLNAWTDQMARELVDAVRRASDDPAIGAIVLTGAGRAYCAGADIREGFAARLDEEGPTQGGTGPTAPDSPDNWVRVAREAKPIVVAVNGVAVGVGLTHTLACDIRIASHRAEFGAFFVRMGLVPELASSYYLAQTVGLGHASELCLTGRLYSAAEAERIGLVNRVVPHDRLLDEALALAHQIAVHPAPQLRWIKDLLTRNAVNGDYLAVQRLEDSYQAQAFRSAEHREAVTAFIEKRPPKFR